MITTPQLDIERRVLTCLAYLSARFAIIAALGWGYRCEWWLVRPEGVQ